MIVKDEWSFKVNNCILKISRHDFSSTSDNRTIPAEKCFERKLNQLSDLSATNCSVKNLKKIPL